MNKANQLLQKEYERRKLINPSYSMRAFGQLLGVPSGRMSEWMQGKRKISQQMAIKIIERLGLESSESESLLLATKLDRLGLTEDHDLTKKFKLTEDQLSFINDWYHFAILAYLDTEGKHSFKSIAQALDLEVEIVQTAMQRLERLALIEKTANSWITKTHVSTSYDQTSRALQQSHLQTLRQTMDLMETVPVELRDISSLTMAIDVEKLPQAKKLIREFKKQMEALLESGARTQVYNLNIQLLPLTYNNLLKSGLNKQQGKDA